MTRKGQRVKPTIDSEVEDWLIEEANKLFVPVNEYAGLLLRQNYEADMLDKYENRETLNLLEQANALLFKMRMSLREKRGGTSQ